MSKSEDIILENKKDIVDKIIKSMEQDNLNWKKTWNGATMLPHNGISNINYFGGNRLRLMFSAAKNEYKDPRWVTFKQAEKEGWKIKKGEKGTLCEKYIFTKTVKELDENGKEIEKEIRLRKPIINYFYLFNGEQIENIPKLGLNNNFDKDKISILKDFIKSSECPIKHVAQDRAYYSPSQDEIVLPLAESFKSENYLLATAFHEMIHSTGHRDRLNRNLSGEFGSKDYAKEELVAELGAIFLQAQLGIKIEEEHFNNHAAYLKSWISILKKDPNELFKAAALSEKACDRLFNNYQKLINEKEKSKEKLKNKEKTSKEKSEFKIKTNSKSKSNKSDRSMER